MNDNTVLVAGGVPALRDAERYDPDTELWTMIAPLPTGHSNHQAALLKDGKLLLAGGDHHNTSVEIYDPEHGHWTTTGGLRTARVRHTLTVLEHGEVLAVGGETAFLTGSRTAEIYDPSTRAWTGTEQLQGKRIGHAATLLKDGSILVLFGLDAGYAAESYLYKNPEAPPPQSNLDLASEADYLLLGLNPNVKHTFAEVKKALREKQKQHHPDRNFGKEAAATEAFKQISAAFDRIKKTFPSAR